MEKMSSDQPPVSPVAPVYNTDTRPEECLDSLAYLIRSGKTEDIPDRWEACRTCMPGTELPAAAAEKWYGAEEEFLPAWKMLCGNTDTPKQIRTVGTFYPRIGNGGVQRVLAGLVSLWTDMGYRVILLTEEEPRETDYDLPDTVKRYCLPKLDGLSPAEIRGRSGERTRCLTEIIRNERIDLLIYHQWLGSFLLWDMLTAKLAGAVFCIYCHSLFTVPLIEKTLLRQYRLMPDIYACADGIVCLTEADRYYWSRYNANVHLTVNPLTFSAGDAKPRTDCSPTLVWVGRLSREKRPEDAVLAVGKAAERIPGIKLLLVGGGDPKEEEKLRDLIRQEGLQENVELCGFQKDVGPYYRRASALLLTSEYEGFCVTAAEAQAYGLPVISYDMPYLPLLAGGMGSVHVPQGDVPRLAEEIAGVLSDPERYRELSRDAVSNVQRFDIDLKEPWQDILKSFGKPAGVLSNGGKVDKMALDMIRQHVTLREGENAANHFTADSLVDAAFPMPVSGPFRGLRRKTALAVRVLMIDGPGAAIRRMTGKKGKNFSRTEKKGD